MSVLAFAIVAAVVFLGVHLVLDAFEQRGRLGQHDEDEGVVQFRKRQARDRNEPPAAA